MYIFLKDHYEICAQDFHLTSTRSLPPPQEDLLVANQKGGDTSFCHDNMCRQRIKFTTVDTNLLVSYCHNYRYLWREI